MIHLSQRLEALSRLVSPGVKLCDVGCDHGFLPIVLVQRGQIEKALAVDVREGPLSAASTHIREAGLEDCIATRISDGLQAVAVGEADSILIAGMGGGLVEHILSASPEVAHSVRELILQPQSEIYQVRRFLQEQGYYILQEDMVWEDGKYYPMMKVHYAPDASVAWDEVELHFGPCLLQAHHPVLLQYLQREQQIQLRVLDRLHHSHPTDAITARIQEIETMLALIAEGISRCS